MASLGHHQVQSTTSLKTFVSFHCDRQATELFQAINSSLDLFNYCIPSRGAILSFYADLFSEYTTYYWINRKRQLSTGPNNDGSAEDSQSKSKIEYVGELTRRFHEMAKLKLADAREDRNSELSGNLPLTRARLSPSKSIPSTITGPESPTASSHSCSSPTNMPKAIPIGPKVIPVSRRTSSCNSTNEAEHTPMSPTAQDPHIDDNVQLESDVNSINIFSEFEDLIPHIDSTLKELINKYNLDDCDSQDSSTILTSCQRKRMRLRHQLSNWAANLLIHLNSKHYDVAVSTANEPSKSKSGSNLLTKQIEVWLANPIYKLLADILLESHDDMKNFFARLLSTTQNCDWLLAYILLEMSKKVNCEKNFSSCMELIIGCQAGAVSLTYILAYLSDNNPKAMANFPKSNIPFLISLCQTSHSLLNVLALEIPDEINPDFLNNLANEVYSKMSNKTHPNCIDSLSHCIICAPNSYKLFLLALDAKLDDRLIVEVKSAAQVIIDSILSKINELALQNNSTQTTLLSQPRNHIIENLLKHIAQDLSRLIEKASKSAYVAGKAREIFYRMSLVYGNQFASKVICYYLNLPEASFWRLLRPLLRKFIKLFGDDGTTLVSQTLSIDAELLTPVYWANLNALNNRLPELRMDLDLVSQVLTDKLCATIFDLNSTAQLIKLCCTSLERVDLTRICIATKHRLCKSLATSYFLMLEIDDDIFPEILSHLRMNLTCMSILKQSSVASHILCRALLERSIVYGHLFNEKFNPDLLGDGVETTNRFQNNTIKLTQENAKVTLGHRFRRLPNHNTEQPIARRMNCNNASKKSDQPPKHSINSYLLIEAFKSSINNIEAFASLFVEFHCPVMFDKNTWPSDDALRVINERNLSILRKFEQVPPLWDLYELIGQAKCLKSCLILVKALLAAHLALWASATTKSCPDKAFSTSRLIPPLAQSGLVPDAFGLTVEVFPYLSSSEVFSVLSDIWQYLKDTNSNEIDDTEMSPEEKNARAKTYLNRLRLFMCQHLPGQMYVKIFKDLYRPAPKMIPA